MKNRLFLYKFKSLLLIILVLLTTISFFPYKSYGASVKYQVAEAAVDKLVDETIYTVAKQTGYKIATQEQVDAMRASFKKQFPSWDFTTAGDINYNDYPNIAKYDRESKEVIIKLDSDLRNWVNTYIGSLPKTAGFLDSDVSQDSGNLVSGQLLKVPNGKVYVYADNNTWTFNTTYYRIDQKKFYRTGWYCNQLDFYYYNSQQKAFIGAVTTVTFGATDYVSPNPIIVTTETGSTTFTKSNYIDNADSLKNFVPYPTKQSELTDTTKLPMELRVPATTDSDNVVTPTVSPFPFPSTTQTPDSDGKVKVGDSTLVYQKPIVDPSTGTIVDPVTTPDTNTVPNTDDTTGQTPDSTNYTVPTTTPKLDFSPLMSATMKFPFCIPWDLWDTYKIFESGSQVFKYEFKQVDVNFGFIGCGSVTVLPNFVLDFSDYPQIDTAVKVLKFIELMLFIVFLILKTRNLIRG